MPRVFKDTALELKLQKIRAAQEVGAEMLR